MNLLYIIIFVIAMGGFVLFKKKIKKHSVFDGIIARAQGSGKRIVLPEGNDDRIIEAAQKASLLNICKITIIGNKALLSEKFSRKAMHNIEIIDVESEGKRREMYSKSLFELRKDKGMTEEKALEILKDPMYYATMMLYSDDADGVVAGAVYESKDVMRPAFQIIKTTKGTSKVSSSFVMEMPEGTNFGENGMMVFADCAVIEDPTDKELAEIAVLSAKTAESICDIKPKVAFLSYSTKADQNIDSEHIQKVKRAYKLARRLDSSLVMDGELQADSAIVPSVAERKCKGSTLEGRANVLVFPDLNSGNIAYKLVQRIAGVKAVGPLLQGLKKPINDLSRGASADEIVLVMAITALQSKSVIKGE